MYHNEEICGSKSNKKTRNTKYILCCMSREKVSISLDKDEKSLRTFNLQHMVKALPLTSWHLTNFCKTHWRSSKHVIAHDQNISFVFMVAHTLTPPITLSKTRILRFNIVMEKGFNKINFRGKHSFFKTLSDHWINWILNF